MEVSAELGVVADGLAVVERKVFEARLELCGRLLKLRRRPQRQVLPELLLARLRAAAPGPL